MRIAICYVYPNHLRRYDALALRFTRTYMEFPPGEMDHELHVYTTGGKSEPQQRRNFDPLDCQFHECDNIGKDIGAYQRAAREIECDLLVCAGAPVHFHRAGWLDWLVRAYELNGPALYGCWGFYEPRHHLRTTFFWCPPALLASYPHQVVNGTRYEFEHGQKSIVNWSRSMGFENYMVTWRGVIPESQWHHVSHKDSLVVDQHMEIGH